MQRRLALRLMEGLLALAFVAGPACVADAQDPMRGLDLSSPDMTVAEMTRAEVEAALKAARGGERADFTGKRLSGLDLSGLDLSGANLRAVRLNHANLLNDLQRWAEALESAQRACVAAPADPGAWNARGLALAGLERRSRTIAAAREREYQSRAIHGSSSADQPRSDERARIEPGLRQLPQFDRSHRIRLRKIRRGGSAPG